MKDTFKKASFYLLMAVVVGVVFAFVFDFLQSDTPAVVAEEPTAVEEPAAEPVTIPTSSEVTGLVDIVKKTQSSVVSINVENDFRNYGRHLIGGGSGVVFDEDDANFYVMTNQHVVAEGEYFSISADDDKRIDVEYVAGDTDTDVAVLKMPKSNLPEDHDITVADLGNSNELIVGQPVLAMGNALGYGQSVTQGIVSAVDRNLENYRGNYAYKLIQTDAAINPGNSGGALVNASGQVIGINVLKIADNNVEGVGFSIPINAAVDISETLIREGYLPVTYLGVNTVNLNLAELERMNLPKGVLVHSVQAGGPAAKANIQQNDLITKIDQTEITLGENLSYEIRSRSPGDQITLTIYRNGEIIEVEVVLSESRIN